MKDRMIDVTPEERVRFETGTDLVPTVYRCPRCDGRLRRVCVWQDSLIRGGGYGGTRRIETDQCVACTYERDVAVATERPPRETQV